MASLKRYYGSETLLFYLVGLVLPIVVAVVVGSQKLREGKTANDRRCYRFCNWSVVDTIRTTGRISNEETRNPSFFERVMIRSRS